MSFLDSAIQTIQSINEWSHETVADTTTYVAEALDHPEPETLGEDVADFLVPNPLQLIRQGRHGIRKAGPILRHFAQVGSKSVTGLSLQASKFVEDHRPDLLRGAVTLTPLGPAFALVDGLARAIRHFTQRGGNVADLFPGGSHELYWRGSKSPSSHSSVRKPAEVFVRISLEEYFGMSSPYFSPFGTEWVLEELQSLPRENQSQGE